MSMESKTTIHTLLLQHFNSGAGAAGYLRGKIPGLSQQLARFFASRSDIDRLQQAELLSERILALTDFADMIPLRSAVATLEIKRLIAYKKQTDHTAHTLYLFLLGIWVYDHVSEIRQAVDASIHSSKPVKMFLFQWTFASLLHDVGYLYYDFEEGQNASSWSLYDEMLSINYFQRYAGELSEEAAEALQESWKVFAKRYELPIHGEQQSSGQLIKALDHIPWLAELLPSYHTGLETMNVSGGFSGNSNSSSESDSKSNTGSLGSGLPEFAYQMASSGYDGHPVVDHGVASGLILLKYTSIWYWLSKHASETHPQLHEELNARFHYFPHVLEKHVIPACKAVAYHNMPGVKFQLEQEPLLYLAVLCDEMQIWDRFLSGSEHIDNWRTIKPCMAEDIEAELIYGETGASLLHLMASAAHYDKLLGNLEKRVGDWSRFVQLSRLDS
ncbi:hypothetical protein [Paenibacillus eucommiae]|uniref:Metal-dependent phosphohydrolase n=1 Tax=Paenibacillus eucommiae TaxID=1355755 RepID=A0ABS4ISN6_9BACL|nr:hypothetical protein [Paenibacillus eucommiae]MBP1990560.1 hypothetical protein [Paenibacillus eucommiae]